MDEKAENARLAALAGSDQKAAALSRRITAWTGARAGRTLRQARENWYEARENGEVVDARQDPHELLDALGVPR